MRSTSRPRRTRRLETTVAVLGLVSGLSCASLSACGVPLDDQPRAIDRTTTTQTTLVPASDGGEGSMSVFFFRGDQLTAERVAMDDDPTIDDAVNAVLGEPEPPLDTRIPIGTELLGFALVDDTAVIDLSDNIEAFTGQAQKEAYAQLVFTALASGRAESVRFRVGGEPVKAPTDQGNLDVVTADDYDPPLNPR